MRKILSGILGAAALLALGAGPAWANRANDTLTVAVHDWWSTLDPYQFPLDEANVFYTIVYETLIGYDERAQKIIPRLAKAWRQVDDKTVEFDLRDDVTFHNGDHFSADDVVATINYLIDPKVPLRFKNSYDWVEKVEKTGPYQVRITAKKVQAGELINFAYRFYIFDGKILDKLDNKADYGRVGGAIATGPYKVVSLDQQKMVLALYDGYYDKNGPYGGHIKNVVARPIPDPQTQIAEFMTGNIDLIRNPSADTARQFAEEPNAVVTPMHNGLLMYITLDAAGPSDNKVMTDQRVRKAFMEAIDRKELAKTIIPGNGAAELLDGICIPSNFGCVSSTKPPDYNPEDAKKLLAEAGYPAGFDLELDVHEPLAAIGEAVAGMVRKVGIRASARPLPLSLYVSMRGAGKFTAFLGFYPTSAYPDMDNLLDFFFDGNRDYWGGDSVIKDAQEKGIVELDQKKRDAIYEKAIDHINGKNYILPVADLPMVFIHTKEVAVKENRVSPIQTVVTDFYWAK